MKIIVSFATIPSRIKYIEPVILSLLNQTIPPDEIQIQTPKYCIKDQSKYSIPSFIQEFPKVKLNIFETDLGSANKWYYTIKQFQNCPDTLLIILDDDCEYPPDTIATLMKEINVDSKNCYCFTGGILPRLPQKVKKFKVSETPLDNTLIINKNNLENQIVDTVQGFSAYSIFPNWFEKFEIEFIEKSEATLTCSDDILISGLLEKIGIKRVQVGPYKTPKVLPQAEINPIHGDGRLLKMTINGISFLQKKLNIWQDVEYEYPKERSVFHKVLIKMTAKIMALKAN